MTGKSDQHLEFPSVTFFSFLQSSSCPFIIKYFLETPGINSCYNLTVESSKTSRIRNLGRLLSRVTGRSDQNLEFPSVTFFSSPQTLSCPSVVKYFLETPGINSCYNLKVKSSKTSRI